MTNHAQFASGEIEALLAANGLQTLDDAFRVGQPLGHQHFHRATRHKNRRVVKFELEEPGGPTTVYIKRQWRRERSLPRPTDFLHRINLFCSPIHEWRGLQILEDIGMNVSQPLGVFWRGWGLAQGAIVTRSLPVELSMADLLLAGKLLEMPTERLNSLIEAAVDVVVRLQWHGISWRSMKAKHFYPEAMRDGSWRIWLIDCEGVSRWATRRDYKRQWNGFVETLTQHSPSLRKPLLAAYGRAMDGAGSLIPSRVAPMKKIA